MPIYEYHCSACGADFEALVFGQESVDCDKCGSSRIEKRVSTFSAGASSQSLRECRGNAPMCHPSQCASGMCPGMRG